MKESLADLGYGVASFVTEILEKSSIPGLSLGTIIAKRGIETYNSNQYLKTEGIKNLVIIKHLCNNLETLVARQPKTAELTYVYSRYKPVRVRVDALLQKFSESVYSDALKEAYDEYPGKDKNTDAIDKLIKLELIPSIVQFIHSDLKGNQTFNAFVDAQLSAFDDERLHDVWVQMWQTNGFNMLYNNYSDFVDAQIKDHKSILAGKPGPKLDAFKKNMEKWQLYMDTLSSFTQIEDIHLFLVNYKAAARASPSKAFDIFKFAKNYMVNSVEMENMIKETFKELNIYTDSLFAIMRLNLKQQLGGSKKISKLH